jgi:uncharacterized protein YkwD
MGDLSVLTTIGYRKSTAVLLTLLAVVAMNATVAVRAQQSPSTTPTTGAAAPAPVQPAQPVQYQVAQPAQYQLAQPVQYQVAQPAQNQAAQPVQYVQQPAAATGDVYGFTNWLNGVRAQYGLSAVGYDPNLEAWAQQNNQQQSARGIGHFVMGPARRQNSAMGSYASIGAMWLSSPAHRAALLDPTIRFIGIAGLGAYWTYNAY